MGVGALCKMCALTIFPIAAQRGRRYITLYGRGDSREVTDMRLKPGRNNNKVVPTEETSGTKIEAFDSAGNKWWRWLGKMLLGWAVIGNALGHPACKPALT